MKRSEMRELIRQELLKTVGGDAAKYIAEDILHIIEKFGMKPPKDGPYPYNTHDWEPEEE